ncbi:MAG: Crp/Fnr family transcriptional regulator [Bacteroidota bacterium]|nr:Crp/Fnr family transcriptional regulator [Ferruginibacter sp.]
MKKLKPGCEQKGCFLCKLCLPEWIPAIEANKKTFHYKRGDLIFTEGEEVKGIYFVFSGTVKIHKKWGKEKELILRFAKGGDIIGHRGLGAELHYPISGTALEPTTVCFIDLAFFKTTITVNNDFTIQLLMFYAEELQRSEKKMSNLAHMQVKGRIAYSLLSLKNKFGTMADGSIDILLSRQDLASYAGTTYETVFRILNEFVQDSTIRVTNKNIQVLNEAQLFALTTDQDL